ncbi:MAG: pitrilysin family protein [Bryobacteraceae bacterium]
MRTLRLFLCLALAVALAAAAPPRRATSYKNLQYPPINDIRVPEPVRFELPNGMVVYLVEDHELPTVSIQAMIRAGSRWEPAGKTGLASITGAVMRTGGSVSRNGDLLDEELDRLGASVETSIGQDSGRARVSVLKEDLDRGIAILADILQHPAFPQEKIDLAKIQQRDAIARRNDEPDGIAFREFNRIIYGPGSPYARQTEYATIDAITRGDVVAFHQRFFQPENIILGAWGDFNAAEMQAKIEKTFGGWARGGQPRPPVPEVDPAAQNRAGLYSINKEDMEQSWVIMGMLGGKQNDPDYCALEVMNEILGGGFASRLFSNVRSAQGLAYAVFSSWNAGWDRPGTFRAAGSSKTTTTIKIYRSMLAEIERMAAGGATADELSRAKDGILRGFAFEFDETGKIVSRLMSYEYFGYPRDYLQQYRAKIQQTTGADVARVAREYLRPGRFAVLFLGKEKGYEALVSSLGQVTPIDITIPAPKPQELAAATPASAARAKALLAAVRTAMGGAALMNVRDFSGSGVLKVETPQGPTEMKMSGAINVAGRMLQKVETPMGEMTMGFDGQTGWMRMGAQAQDMPASQRDQTEASLFRDPISLLQKLDSPAYTMQALEPAELDGKKVEAVAVRDPARNLQVKLYVDPAANLIVGEEFTGSIMGPPAETQEVYSDYREVAGVRLPFKTVTRQGGKTVLELTFSELRINPGLEDAAYKKP